MTEIIERPLAERDTRRSNAQILNAVAREKLQAGGIDAVKAAIDELLTRFIDGRAGVEWDHNAVTDPEFFIALEVVAEWIDYGGNSRVAERRQLRPEMGE